MYYVVGDSHVREFNGMMGMTICHIGSCTAHNLISDNSKTNSKIKLLNIVEKMNKEKDTLILVFGEIDCRLHIYREFRKSQIHSINYICMKTIENYMAMLKYLKDKDIDFIVYSITPAGYQDNIFNYIYYAPLKIRKQIHYKFNKILKNYCEYNEYKFLDIFKYISTNDQRLRKYYTNDNIHLNKKVQIFILEKLVKIK